MQQVDLRDERSHGRSVVLMDDHDRHNLAAASDLVADGRRVGKVVLWLVAPATIVTAVAGVLQLFHH